MEKGQEPIIDNRSIFTYKNYKGNAGTMRMQNAMQYKMKFVTESANLKIKSLSFLCLIKKIQR